MSLDCYLFGFFPLHWPHFACSSAGGEIGGTSQPGRAFSVRSDRGRVIQRGVAPPASWEKKESPPFFFFFFFIVKDAVECDGLISDGPGREISTQRKDRGKRKQRGAETPPTPPSSLSPSPGLLWGFVGESCGLNCCLFSFFSSSCPGGGGAAKVLKNPPVYLNAFGVWPGNVFGESDSGFLSWTEPVGTAEVRTAASFPALLLLFAFLLDLKESIQACREKPRWYILIHIWHLFLFPVCSVFVKHHFNVGLFLFIFL